MPQKLLKHNETYGDECGFRGANFSTKPMTRVFGVYLPVPLVIQLCNLVCVSQMGNPINIS
jgi:hypothetical protein